MLTWSLILSAVIHLVLLVVPRFTLRIDFSSGGPASPAQPTSGFGMEMIVVVPTDGAPDLPAREEIVAEVPVLQQPRSVPSPTTQPTAPGQSEPAETEAPPGPSGPTPRDALQPGYRDPRLYAPSTEFRDLERTAHERYMERLQARIDAVNDSLGVAADRERRTSDWTVTDGSGNRWGLSPDGLHLGGVTIPRAVLPLPAPTGDNQTIEAERERQRQRDEIQRQEEAGERARTRDERIDAIRDNQDRARSEGSGNPQ